MIVPVPSYEPSGRVNGPRLSLVGLAGIAACAALGLVYQLAQQAMPLLWFACLYTLAAALLVAMVSGLLSKAAHVRGRGTALWMGAVWGFAAIAGSFVAAYASTCTQLMGGDSHSNAGLVPSRPPAFAEYLAARIRAGWVIGRGRELNGAFVVAAWSAEAALLVYAGARGALPGVYEPFCETCGRFARRLFAFPHAVDASALRAASARGDLATVLTVPESAARSRLALYEVRVCPGCGKGWLDVLLESAGAEVSGREAGTSPLPMLWLSELLSGCAGSLAALAGSPAGRSTDRPLRATELDGEEVRSLRARLTDGDEGRPTPAPAAPRRSARPRP